MLGKYDKNYRPLLDEADKDIVFSLFDFSDNPSAKDIFDLYFFKGYNDSQVAECCHYSVRNVERLKWRIMLILFKRAISLLKERM